MHTIHILLDWSWDLQLKACYKTRRISRVLKDVDIIELVKGSGLIDKCRREIVVTLDSQAYRG